MYNDEDLSGTSSSTYGHTKGVLGFDMQGGFWLIHSTPGWPPARTSGYDYTNSSKIYGQSFLCINFDITTLNDVGTQLTYNRPLVYDSYVSSDLATAIPNLASAIGLYAITSYPASNTIILKSIGGTSFVSFAKNAKWGQDLYNILVAPYFNSALYVETWMRPYQPSCCIPNPNCTYDAINVQNMAIPNTDISFNETKDHSKWAITTFASNKTIVCVGDINRNLSQWGRAGGTACFDNKLLYASLMCSISNTDACSDSVQAICVHYNLSSTTSKSTVASKSKTSAASRLKPFSIF